MVVSHLLSLFLSFMNNSDVFFTMNLLQIFSFAGLSGLMVSLFLFPEILYGLSRFSQAVLPPTSEVEGKVEIVARDYNFESSYILLIQQKTDRCMIDFQPYLQPELNLNRFADILQLPAHHLAYYFREVKKQSFNDYINGCRIEFAISMLRQGKTSDLTLEAVGVMSGFTNRSTFFRAFKKIEGISPGSFLATKGKVPSPT
jgi:AraC-like DNA-binding protein